MLTVVLIGCLIGLTAAIPIDNGVQGDPEIECADTGIIVTFNTINSFEGHVYVKGLYDQQENGCRISGDGTQAIGTITLPFDSCNTQRERSANPRGIFVRTNVVINFHPNFITKVDRAYTIQCFYMEAEKTVSTQIEVSMITTGFQTQNVPMPICRYEILDAPDGTPVAFALIGQPVFHKWTCDTETEDTFCMFVYSCFVVDPAGNDRLDLIDEAGCATDKYLLGNIEYPSDLMGVKEVHVFKYADRPALAFQCQINIAVKEPGLDCVRPECPEPPGAGDGLPNIRRAKRQAFLPRSDSVVDVASQLETLEIDDRNNLPRDLSVRAPSPRDAYAPVTVNREEDGLCMSPAAFAGFICVALALVAAIMSIVVLLARRQRK